MSAHRRLGRHFDHEENMSLTTNEGRRVELIPTAPVDTSKPLRVQLQDGDKITAADAARLLCVDRGTIDKWLNKGRLTRWNKGTHVLIPWAEVEQMLKDGFTVAVKSSGPLRLRPKRKSAA